MLSVGLAERLRQGHRTAAQQLERRPLLLPLRGLAPLHQLVRAARRRRASSRSASPASSARSNSGPTRTASPPRRPGRSIERADVSANDFHVKGNATQGRRAGAPRVRRRRERPLRSRSPRHASGLQPRRRGHQRRHQRLGRQRAPHRHRRLRPGRRRRREAGPAVGRPPRRLRHDREHRRLLRRPSTDNGAFSGFAAAPSGRSPASASPGRSSRGFRDPTLSDRYLPRPVRPRLHHRQSGSRAGDEPAVRPRRALRDRPTQLAVYFYNYRSTISSSAIRRRPISSSSAIAAARRVRGFEFEARTALPWDVALEVGSNIGRGEALDDDANLDDISPDTFSVLVQEGFRRTGVRADARRVPRRRRSARARAKSRRPGRR